MRGAPVLDPDKPSEIGIATEPAHASAGPVRRAGAFLVRESFANSCRRQSSLLSAST